MKRIMTATLLLGLAVVGLAGIAKVRTMASSATIVSGIADLRQENNLTECQRVESHASRRLRKMQDSFIPIMWLGGIITVTGITGLIIAARTPARGTANQKVDLIN
jgi:hypothetical protein